MYVLDWIVPFGFSFIKGFSFLIKFGKQLQYSNLEKVWYICIGATKLSPVILINKCFTKVKRINCAIPPKYMKRASDFKKHIAYINPKIGSFLLSVSVAQLVSLSLLNSKVPGSNPHKVNIVFVFKMSKYAI